MNLRRWLGLVAIVAVLLPLHGDSQGLIFQLPRIQFFDNNGVILNGGKVCTYAAGTTTPQATFSDQALTIPNTNPLILDGAGRFQTNVYLSQVSYKFVLLTAGTDNTCSTGVQIWSSDQVPGAYAASVIVSGVFPTARLASSGSATAITFLRGDQSWSTPWTVITSTDVGTQNNWNPSTGVVGNTIIRCNNASTLTVTGFSTGYDGQQIIVQAIGGNLVAFAHQNAGSSASGRLTNIVTSNNTNIASGGYVKFIYDGTSFPGSWRLVDHEQGQWLTPTFSAGNYTGNGAMTWTVAGGNVTTNRYYLKGKMLTLNVLLQSTGVGGTPNTTLQINGAAVGSYTAATTTTFASDSTDSGANPAPGLCSTTGGLSSILCFKSGLANWTAGATTAVSFSVSYEVQ